ncbi:MAG: ComF family protein [Dehalococcoidales bacterium]|nr:ComF family protein [Dehalococcoidales bacterium]
MLPQLTKLKGIALNLLFPQWCVGCGKEGDFICYSCRRSLPRIMPPLCPRCGRPQPSGILCHGCVGWQAEIDGIRSPFRFDGVVRQSIYQLKYRNLRALAEPLAKLLRDYLSTNPVPGEALVPVPLHQKRLRERGYNQSSLLARELGKLINLPVVDDCLIRLRHAPPQARTSTVDERRSNVAGAFTCRDQRLKDKQVLLIDDVSTSGATLDACAGVLKAVGATSVWGLVLAREI